jgi:hypothetical protein
VHREVDPQQAEDVQQQVPGVDPLAAVAVADPAADQGADARRDGIGAERADNADGRVSQVVGLGSQRQDRAAGHDRSGVEIAGHGGGRLR